LPARSLVASALQGRLRTLPSARLYDHASAFLLDSVIVFMHIYSGKDIFIHVVGRIRSSSGGAMVDEYLTIEEAASRVKVKPDTLRLWLRTGRLKGLKAGRLWRVRPTDLEAFLEQSAKEALERH
jgi:excisionase family DNA binding protein